MRGSAEIDDKVQVVRDFIAGRIPPEHLARAGIKVSTTEHGYRVDEQHEAEVVQPTVLELAGGLLRAWDSGPETAHRWASVVLLIPSVDLSELENSAAGGRLLELLWEVADPDGSIAPADIVWARGLVRGNSV